ncbi:hypothetical protein [Listeria monocytogenes]|uniref:hypothetical protein n=1 Tax=Listeria monocytogenes TaxID=1639 RepID=UPI0011EA7D25|nr:hypothetical protein [Listeria monocytogenes]TYV33113.1 hypothetical protein FZ060_14835 [Listeria monocytogenes]
MSTLLNWFKSSFKPKQDISFDDKIKELKYRMQKLNHEMDRQLKRRECEGFSAYISIQNEELVTTKEDHWLVG